jgi:hypothetical protein
MYFRLGVDVIDVGRRDDQVVEEAVVPELEALELLDLLLGVHALDGVEVAGVAEGAEDVDEGELPLAHDGAVEDVELRRLPREGGGVVAAEDDEGVGEGRPRDLRRLDHVDERDGEAGDADDIRLDLVEPAGEVLVADALGHAVEEEILMLRQRLLGGRQDVEQTEGREGAVVVGLEVALALLVRVLDDGVLIGRVDEEHPQRAGLSGGRAPREGRQLLRLRPRVASAAGDVVQQFHGGSLAFGPRSGRARAR